MSIEIVVPCRSELQDCSIEHRLDLKIQEIELDIKRLNGSRKKLIDNASFSGINNAFLKLERDLLLIYKEILLKKISQIEQLIFLFNTFIINKIDLVYRLQSLKLSLAFGSDELDFGVIQSKTPNIF